MSYEQIGWVQAVGTIRHENGLQYGDRFRLAALSPKPEGGGWYPAYRRISFDSLDLVERYEKELAAMRNECDAKLAQATEAMHQSEIELRLMMQENARLRQGLHYAGEREERNTRSYDGLSSEHQILRGAHRNLRRDFEAKEKQNQGLKSTNANLIMRASAAEEAEQAAKEEVARLMSNMYDRATQERAQIEAYERGRSEGHDAGTHDALDSLASEYRRRLQHIVVPF